MSHDNVFEKNVELYEKWFETNGNILNSEIEAIRALLPHSGKGIEIGVGTGVFSSKLGINTGVEPSAKMREKAAAKGINVIDAVAEKLPIENEIYDYALMVTVDCFLDDVEKAFNEIWRILSKNGYFIIAFIDKETPLGTVYNENKHLDNFYKHANFHSASEIEALLTKAGFEIKAKKQTIYLLENTIQKINDGVGDGVFAVIKGKKV